MKKLIALISFLALLLFSCKQETYYNITTKVEPEGSGSIVVTPSSGAVLDGTSVSFLAKPNGDYVFSEWSGGLSGEVNPQTVTVSSDLSVTAKFTLRSYPLTITVEGEGTVSEKVISTRSDYTAGTVVELTANPSEHWVFDHWEGDLNGNTNPGQITVSSSKAVKAVFVKKMYDLTVNVEGEGAVSETVKETRSGSYQEGTVVELTATPATGWSFDHWEGDLTSTDNPAQITISSAKSVKAIFTKNKYAYNLKIVGPGVVDEYLVPETRADLDYGTSILLKAIPAEGAVFQGWSGDIKSTEAYLTLQVDTTVSLVASFCYTREDSTPPDLLSPSRSFRKLYYGLNAKSVACGIHQTLELDYNRDGYIDIVYSPFDSKDGNIAGKRFPVRFYLGTESGSFIPDCVNDCRFAGNIWPRKQIYGDYNRDGYPDICLIGHGADTPPWPGEYPILLMSENGPVYHENRLTDLVSYFHGGASGDFDNDGDLDILLVCSSHGDPGILVNDGTGHFIYRTDLFNQDLKDGVYNCELYDLDKDGFLDAICGCDDPIRIIWGNGSGFNHNDYLYLPMSSGFGISCDFLPYDIDSDGIEELLVLRTSSIDPVYVGWSIQVLERNGRSFTDATSKFINGDFYNRSIFGWYPWMDIEMINGNNCLIVDDGPDPYVLFVLDSGKLIPYSSLPKSKLLANNGFHVFSDSEIESSEPDYLHYDICDIDSYAGSQCLWFHDWKVWDSAIFTFNPNIINGTDLSILERGGYALEFFIKNDDPSLRLDIKFESFINRREWITATYFSQYVPDSGSLGQWSRVIIPLADFEDWTDSKDDYWSKIDYLQFQISSEGGKDFYLDEIRIRKVLPE